ncbi:hypothetical protein PM082_020906 [Marasmius tenuissimus]|nr:hypothetical protein PM082_020906 [Marasmius tenuissimus]
MNFIELPSELLLAILSLLDGRSIAYSSQVNRSLHTLVTSSSILCYKQQLFIYKKDDNVSNRASVAEKLRLLKREESSWRHCQPGFHVKVPLTFNPGSVYDLASGVYILGEDGRQTLRYIDLPSNPVQELKWKAFMPQVESKEPRSIVDFAINLHEHNLISLITESRSRNGNTSLFKLELRLHEFSTGKPHPQAKRTTLPITNSEHQYGVQPAVNCEIVGDHLALVAYFWRDPTAPCDVLVYNWKTGERLMKVAGNSSTYGGIIFLSVDKILLPNILENTLEIWKIPSPGEEPPEGPMLRLGLFQTAPNYNIRYISCRAEPNPAPLNAVMRTDRPFYASADDAIVLLHLRIQGMGEFSLLTVFVHRSALLKIAEDGSETDVPIPWNEWAPNIAFCYDCSGDRASRWITTTCGQRYVLLPLSEDEDLDPNLTSNVVILDFGKSHVQKIEQDIEAGKIKVGSDVDEYGPIVRRGPHHLPRESKKMFADDMICHLPYVESRSREKYAFNGVLMDEERVIGIKVLFPWLFRYIREADYGRLTCSWDVFKG